MWSYRFYLKDTILHFTFCQNDSILSEKPCGYLVLTVKEKYSNSNCYDLINVINDIINFSKKKKDIALDKSISTEAERSSK